MTRSTPMGRSTFSGGSKTLTYTFKNRVDSLTKYSVSSNPIVMGISVSHRENSYVPCRHAHRDYYIPSSSSIITNVSGVNSTGGSNRGNDGSPSVPPEPDWASTRKNSVRSGSSSGSSENSKIIF